MYYWLSVLKILFIQCLVSAHVPEAVIYSAYCQCSCTYICSACMTSATAPKDVLCSVCVISAAVHKDVLCSVCVISAAVPKDVIVQCVLSVQQYLKILFVQCAVSAAVPEEVLVAYGDSREGDLVCVDDLNIHSFGITAQIQQTIRHEPDEDGER